MCDRKLSHAPDIRRESTYKSVDVQVRSFRIPDQRGEVLPSPVRRPVLSDRPPLKLGALCLSGCFSKPQAVV
jgi:hypothetical protein